MEDIRRAGEQAEVPPDLMAKLLDELREQEIKRVAELAKRFKKDEER